jgi:hypothetical protein
VDSVDRGGLHRGCDTATYLSHVRRGREARLGSHVLEGAGLNSSAPSFGRGRLASEVYGTCRTNVRNCGYSKRNCHDLPVQHVGMVASLTRRWMERLCPGSNGPIRRGGVGALRDVMGKVRHYSGRGIHMA